MSSDQGSGFEWRRKRGGVNKAFERIEDLPINLAGRRGALTDSAKRKLFEEGLPGRAQILKAPGEHSISQVHENIGRFHARVELPGRDPYEVKVWQSFQGGYEWDGLQEGALIECRVDPGDDKNVLLLAPEPDQERVTAVDSAGILSQGRRASAEILEAEALGMNAPGTDDPVYRLKLRLSSDAEPEPWEVEIGQRVPAAEEKTVTPGGRLTAAYIEVDGGDSVAVDWDG